MVSRIGLTATPKRVNNIDTYRYFGEPVYIYSLKEGINDGFLTPFKVKRISTTLDDYVYTSDDTVVEGEVEAGKVPTLLLRYKSSYSQQSCFTVAAFHQALCTKNYVCQSMRYIASSILFRLSCARYFEYILHCSADSI